MQEFTPFKFCFVASVVCKRMVVNFSCATPVSNVKIFCHCSATTVASITATSTAESDTAGSIRPILPTYKEYTTKHVQ